VDYFSIQLHTVVGMCGFDGQEKYRFLPLVLNHQMKNLPDFNMLF